MIYAAVVTVLHDRDPAFVRRVHRFLESATSLWYRPEVLGVEHLSDRASLVVSTHNGGFWMPDVYTLLVAFWRRFGPETPLHGLMHSFALRLPVLGRLWRKLGAIPAHPDCARMAFEADRPVLVCPGGDVDALKPWRRRHEVSFGERRGFVRTALRHRVPIVPVVSVGAHEVFFVLNDGRRWAEATGFARVFRVKSVPFAFGLPFGITPAGFFNLPFPSKVVQRVLPPIAFDEPPEAAGDPAVVERCFERIRAEMQAALDELAARRRWPILG